MTVTHFPACNEFCRGDYHYLAGTAGPMCGVKLFRCCGEGPLVCEKPAGHDGPHEDEGVLYG